MNALGLDFKVTHIAPDGVKHVRVVRGAAGGPAAIEWMDQLYGDSRAASALFLGPTAAPQGQNNGGAR